MDTCQLESIDLATLPSLALGQRRSLPQSAAIYFVLNQAEDVLYIGRTQNLHMRWENHHRFSDFVGHDDTRIAWLVVSDIPLLPAIEAACIAYFQPAYQPPRPDNTKYVTLYLAAVFWRDFRVACMQRGVSASAIVNAMIRDQLTRWAQETP